MRLIKNGRFTFYSWIALFVIGIAMIISWYFRLNDWFFLIPMYLFSFVMGFVTEKLFQDIKNKTKDT